VELRVLRELRGECFLGMGEGGSVPSASLWLNLSPPQKVIALNTDFLYLAYIKLRNI